MNRKINETLAELMTGIILAGIVIQLVQILVCTINPYFWDSAVPFAVGLWIGVVTAIGLAIHMYCSINKALDMITNDAESYMRRAYLIRTAAILVVAGVVTFLKAGHVMAVFLGVLCLKFGAFLQPLVHMLRKKFRK